jgi:hypothetical protein
MRRRARAVFALAGACALLAGCAKKGPPSGGPPDLEPPRVVATAPDSFAAGVDRAPEIAITFSEGMEPRSTGDAVSLAPRVEIRQRRWSGRTLALRLADTLARDRTYTLIVAPTARDRHGNPLAGGMAIVFSTAAAMPPGAIEGTLETVGFVAEGTYLWCYDAARGRQPDSTARDYDALGLAGAQGGFRVLGLPVPGSYRLWVFADLNANRSFEPATDLLVPVDTTFALAEAAPRVGDLRLRVVNPRAVGRVRGVVTDTLGIAQGDLLVSAISTSDSTRSQVARAGTRGAFELTLQPDYYRIEAFRDLDHNRVRDPLREPGSAPVQVTVPPAADIQDLRLVLLPAGRGP